MSIRLIAIDIDGTLIPSSGLSISRRNWEALRAAEAAGIEIAIATGRRQAFAMPLIAPLELSPESVMISSNGAILRRLNGDLLDRHFLPAETAQKLAGELRGYRTLVFTFDREGVGGLVVENLNQLHAWLDRWIEANRPHLIEIEPIERAFDGGELPIQGMVCGTLEQMGEAEEGLRGCGLGGEIAMHRTEYPARGLSILDLLPPGCSKGIALHQLAQMRDLGRHEIMAIGDNLNDLEMLEYAGRAVVMANASEQMLIMAREHGWELTASNDEDGVALAVEQVLRKTLEISGKIPDGNSAAALNEDTIGEDTMAGWAR